MVHVHPPLGLERNPIPQYGKNGSPRALGLYHWAAPGSHCSCLRRPWSLGKHTEYVAFVTPTHKSLRKVAILRRQARRWAKSQGDSGAEISQFKNILQVAYTMCTSSFTLHPHVLWQLACLCLFVPLTCDYSEGRRLSQSPPWEAGSP